MSTAVQYKALPEEQQLQPYLPEGYGVKRVDFDAAMTADGRAKTLWFPCRLLTLKEAETLYLTSHSFYGAYHGGLLRYKDRRKAISFVWRWYRRYGDAGVSLAHNLMPCSTGIPGHLYQMGNVTVAEAAERLGLSVKDVQRRINEYSDSATQPGQPV